MFRFLTYRVPFCFSKMSFFVLAALLRPSTSFFMCIVLYGFLYLGYILFLLYFRLTEAVMFCCAQYSTHSRGGICHFTNSLGVNVVNGAPHSVFHDIAYMVISAVDLCCCLWLSFIKVIFHLKLGEAEILKRHPPPAAFLSLF